MIKTTHSDNDEEACSEMLATWLEGNNVGLHYTRTHTHTHIQGTHMSYVTITLMFSNDQVLS